jgi:predicted transposase/invertase (TIGR01784 family)
MTKRLIRFDWAVKKLLRNKANFVVLEGFLSELLFDDIKIQKILESESNQETENDKYNRVDILIQNSKNELIIVEIQNTYEIDFFHQMIYGTSKALIENISLGQPYSEIKKVISINVEALNPELDITNTLFVKSESGEVLLTKLHKMNESYTANLTVPLKTTKVIVNFGSIVKTVSINNGSAVINFIKN